MGLFLQFPQLKQPLAALLRVSVVTSDGEKLKNWCFVRLFTPTLFSWGYPSFVDIAQPSPPTVLHGMRERCFLLFAVTPWRFRKCGTKHDVPCKVSDHISRKYRKKNQEYKHHSTV